MKRLDPKKTYYIGQDGQLEEGTPNDSSVQPVYNRKGDQVSERAVSVDARAPISKQEIRSRNQNEDFFSSRSLSGGTQNDGAQVRAAAEPKSTYTVDDVLAAPRPQATPTVGSILGDVKGDSLKGEIAEGVSRLGAYDALLNKLQNGSGATQDTPQGPSYAPRIAGNGQPFQDNGRTILFDSESGQPVPFNSQLGSQIYRQTTNQTRSGLGEVVPHGTKFRPYIGDASGDVTKDYLPGGKFSSAPRGSDPNEDKNYVDASGKVNYGQSNAPGLLSSLSIRKEPVTLPGQYQGDSVSDQLSALRANLPPPAVQPFQVDPGLKLQTQQPAQPPPVLPPPPKPPAYDNSDA